MTSLSKPAYPFVAIVLLAISGCGYSASKHRVEPATALQTLKQVLDSWKQGDTPESWQQRSPAVVVQDFDWKAGRKLQEYEILNEGESVDANLYCNVKLTFSDARAGKSERTVTYLVGTSPVLTVFRSPTP